MLLLQLQRNPFSFGRFPLCLMKHYDVGRGFSSTTPTALLNLWQSIALQRSRALIRVAAAVLGARPDLQAAIPSYLPSGNASEPCRQQQLLRLCTLSTGDADLVPLPQQAREQRGLQLCIPLPHVSAHVGRSMMLRVWIDPVSSAVRMVLGEDHVPSSCPLPGASRVCPEAMPLCAVLIECMHHAQSRLKERLTAIASAISASDLSSRSNLRGSLQLLARAQQSGSVAAAVGESAGNVMHADRNRRGSVDGAASVTSSVTSASIRERDCSVETPSSSGGTAALPLVCNARQHAQPPSRLLMPPSVDLAC